jgi:hypothetical protein
VKPAVLFGDRVKLISFRNDLKSLVRADAFENSRMPIRYLYNYVFLTIRNNPTELKLLDFPASSMCSESDARAFLNRDSMGDRNVDPAHRYELIVTLEQKYSAQLSEYRAAVGRLLRSRWKDLSSDDLDGAVDVGILQYVPWLEVDRLGKAGLNADFVLNWIETDAYVDAALDTIIDRLANCSGVPMLDQGARSLLIKPFNSQCTEASSVERRLPDYGTAIATMLSAHLPGLRDLSIAEIVDLRSELGDHLSSFRGYMVELSDELSDMPDADSNALARKLTSYWERSIGPALEDIRREVKVARYPRRLLDAFAADKASVVSMGSAIVLGAGTSIAGLSALIPAVAAASYPFIRALNDRAKAREEVRGNRLYFLYEVAEKIVAKRH